MPSNPDLDKIIAGLQAAKERQQFRKLDFYRPYPKQRQFHNAGAIYRERLLMAANRAGKSYCGAAETAIHVTGEYPLDWEGRRWTRPIKTWAVGETGTVVRDISQGLLCGEPGADALFGSGLIPREAFDGKPSLARGVTDAYDTIAIKHLAPDQASVDGISILRFKTYEQGRQKLQGESLDFFWCDEEPPQAEYAEILTRIGDKDGCGIITFTPMKGMSKVVLRFLNEQSPDRIVIGMTIEDAEHISPDRRQAIIDGYLPHEREARSRGIPMMGEGAVFTTPESMIMEPAMEYIPEFWSKLWTMDFGIAHPFAAVLSAWDKDTDVFHVLHTIRMSDAQPIHHAKALKMVANNIPVGWPHDGNNREKGSGEVLSKLYKAEGLLTTPTHMTWPDGGVSVEAGIMEMHQRMNTGRFKVASHLSDWFEEYRMYHRKDGLIVATNNDLLDATRGGIMGKRYGKALPILRGLTRPSKSVGVQIADGLDFDVLAY